MGRVYAMKPAGGERAGDGCRLFTHQGQEIWPIYRVEFDDDADEGMATVTSLVTTVAADRRSLSGFVFDPDANEAARATFRAWVCVVGRGRPNPPVDAEGILVRDAAGRVSRLPGSFFEPKLVPAEAAS